MSIATAVSMTVMMTMVEGESESNRASKLVAIEIAKLETRTNMVLLLVGMVRGKNG